MNKKLGKSIYVTRPTLPPVAEYMEYLNDIWESRNLTNMGKYLQIFLEQLKAELMVENCIPVCNGHMALEMILEALDLKGEVITTPFTFASTTHAIVRNNLTPVFCDIKENDCTIDSDKIENLITEKTTAILPVHVYGMPCDVGKINAIAQKHNIKVIYDAAHAFGVTIEGKSVAYYGDASMFSFHATKAFNSIEGGCAVVKRKSDLLRIYQLHNFGIMDEENVDYAGANAKMNEFQAAMGICNLRYFNENLQKRKNLVDIYIDRLSEIEGIAMLCYDKVNVGYNYSYFPIFVDESKYGKSRDQIYKMLKERNIFSRKYFYPLTCDFNCYKDKEFKSDVPVARRMSDNVLTLPLYSELEPQIVEEICDILRDKDKDI